MIKGYIFLGTFQNSPVFASKIALSRQTVATLSFEIKEYRQKIEKGGETEKQKIAGAGRNELRLKGGDIPRDSEEKGGEPLFLSLPSQNARERAIEEARSVFIGLLCESRN